MKTRRYSNDSIALLEQGKAIMTSSDESKYMFRVFAVNLVVAGTPASQGGVLARRYQGYSYKLGEKT